jgi:hypothetical protein
MLHTKQPPKKYQKLSGTYAYPVKWKITSLLSMFLDINDYIISLSFLPHSDFETCTQVLDTQASLSVNSYSVG